MKKSLFYILIVIALSPLLSSAQQKNKGGTFFQTGVASGFIGGLYDGWYPNRELKKHGDFGLGAPDKLDGEMLMLKGKIYQTRADGHTSVMTDDASTSLALVTFFHAQKIFRLPHAMDKQTFYHYLDSLLSNPNAIYAIHIYGSFDSATTRAFPPPPLPYRPLAELLPLQHFFHYQHINGDLVGYRLPLYLESLSIHGYHFHFLSADKNNGGHIIDLGVKDVTIEIAELPHFAMTLPDSKGFREFNFGKDRKAELKSVENGK
ncbi:acetolactate decarboxylase [Chitinophaga vietnamensis]|uniref:acetolactate decarboxylase n=1 Tax=Chitinophaga vietnamensis TaxID=2593957 RepID=UPI001177BCB8|nr:acetolactate decarboxylase [Chitinophaga vietnamensis]